MRRIIRILFLVGLVGGLVSAGLVEAWARGGRVGGARSSGGSRSGSFSRSSSGSSRSSFSKPSTPSKPASAPSKSSSSPFGNRQSTIQNTQRNQSASPSRSADPGATSGKLTGTASQNASVPTGSRSAASQPMSAADQATLMKARTQGTVFKNKTEAQQAFASSPAIKARYPSTFQAEPAVRPDYIPPSTSLNGMSYPVTYNAFQGGYGFMGPLGAWITYDALSDSAMRDHLMRQNNYVVQTAEMVPGAAGLARPSVQPVHRGTSFFNIFFGLLVFGGVVGLLVMLARKTSKF